LDEFEQQLLLAHDGIRQQQIDQENQAFLEGIAILSRYPDWNAIQAEICSLNAAELEKPFPRGIDEMRTRAFEFFDKKAEALLPTVSDTETADAYCGVLPVLSRAAFWDCRLGQPTGAADSILHVVKFRSSVFPARGCPAHRASQNERIPVGFETIRVSTKS
jgi:hypothetical protein